MRLVCYRCCFSEWQRRCKVSKGGWVKGKKKGFTLVSGFVDSVCTTRKPSVFFGKQIYLVHFFRNLTRPGPPKGSWGRESYLISRKSRLVNGYNLARYIIAYTLHMRFIVGSGFIATKITALQEAYVLWIKVSRSKTKTGFEFRQNQLSSEQKPWLSLGCVDNIMNTLLATNISPLQVCFSDDFPFPNLGYGLVPWRKILSC